MNEKIFNVRVIDGIRAIKRFLDSECITFDYVYHADKIHEGPNFVVPKGVPVIFIERFGIAGYILHIDTLDEDFNRVQQYAIKFSISLKKVQETQSLLNQLLIQHEQEKESEEN